MSATPHRPGASCVVSLLAVVACSPAEPADDPALVPPVFGEAAIEPWLAAGYYLAWPCEPAARPSVPPAPAGLVRRCTNPIAAAASAQASWPVDSSWVFELYAGSDAATATVRGHFVMRRSQPDPGSASWYWYGSSSDEGLEADGWGLAGPPLTDCSACHAVAPHDFVY